MYLSIIAPLTISLVWNIIYFLLTPFIFSQLRYYGVIHNTFLFNLTLILIIDSIIGIIMGFSYAIIFKKKASYKDLLKIIFSLYLWYFIFGLIIALSLYGLGVIKYIFTHYFYEILSQPQNAVIAILKFAVAYFALFAGNRLYFCLKKTKLFKGSL